MKDRNQIILIIINSLITILIYYFLFSLQIKSSFKLLLMFLNLNTLFIAPLIIAKFDN